MEFAEALEGIGPKALDEILGLFLGVGPGSFWEAFSTFLFQFAQLLKPSCPGHHGGSGHHGVFLCFRTHPQFEVIVLQVTLDEGLLGKLVEQSPSRLAHLEGIVEGPSVQPSKELVQVLAELIVQFIVFRHARVGRLDDHALGTDNELVHLHDHAVRDGLAVADAAIHPFADHVAVGNDTGRHHGPEEVALAAFVEAGMRLEPLRIVHLLVAKEKFPGDLGFQYVLDEILGSPALDDQLSAGITNNVQLLSLVGEISILHLVRKPASRLQEKTEFLHLLIVELDGIHRFLGLFAVAIS
uniref:Uncharacterized protein n=1 Tax=uncultured marine microorganism HF4000_APKG3D20 TaxID=455549 RepID=B3T7B2_9ZZZZ|nr:hypothetical protein ALOHA_HF4000APKG3D20ctg1g19 [uncultured marine microorganism HF4000_APKG3D20]